MRPRALQSATGPSILVTARVWQFIAGNDYLSKACACSQRADPNVWTEIAIRRLPDGDAQALGRKSTYPWCAKHIDEICQAVLAGKKKRSAPTPRATASKSTTKSARTAGSRSSRTPSKTAPKTAESVTTPTRKRAVAKAVVKSPGRKSSTLKPKPVRR